MRGNLITFLDRWLNWYLAPLDRLNLPVLSSHQGLLPCSFQPYQLFHWSAPCHISSRHISSWTPWGWRTFRSSGQRYAILCTSKRTHHLVSVFITFMLLPPQDLNLEHYITKESRSNMLYPSISSLITRVISIIFVILKTLMSARWKDALVNQSNHCY